MTFPTTLHVSLKETTLDDFAEHLEASIKDIVRWGELKGEPIDRYGTIMWQPAVVEGMWAGMMLGPGECEYTVVVNHSQSGNTGYTWLCRWIGHNGGFVLAAQRFSQDRVKLYLREFQDRPIYAPRLMEWLRRRWDEDLITELPTDTIPELTSGNHIESPEEIRERLKSIKKGSPLWRNIFFNWYEQYNLVPGQHITQKQLTELAGYSPKSSHLKNMLGDWKSERESQEEKEKSD